jgi:hypothetical protein
MAEWLKKPLGKSINSVAIQQAQNAINRTGRNLPCRVVKVVSSGIVTVSFEVNSAPFTLPQVTIPVGSLEYIRYPIQVGDLGWAVSASVRLNNASGQGGGVPTLDPPGNLSALVFLGLGSANWSATDNANALVLYGPDGVILRTSSSSHKITIDNSGVNVDNNILINGNELGFFNTSPVNKPTVTGLVSSISDLNAKIVIKSIIHALSSLGLITDSTT